MLCLPPAISGPHAGQVVPHPERLITFLPPAVYTSVLAATPIHYLPWSKAAHSSPLSATASFSVWTPSRGRAWLLSKTCWLLIRRRTGRRGSRLNPTAGITSFLFFLVGPYLWCEHLNFATHGTGGDVSWEIDLSIQSRCPTGSIYCVYRLHYILCCVRYTICWYRDYCLLFVHWVRSPEVETRWLFKSL